MCECVGGDVCVWVGANEERGEKGKKEERRTEKKGESVS